MTKQIGIRELVRDTSVLDKYDIIEIEDKKTKTPKGVFVSQKYADEIKEFIKKKEQTKKKERLSRFMQYAGILDGATQDKKIGELKMEKERRYEG